jgi:ubiquinone/menaquinone biosynthesis C-methylase UbiE
MTTTQTDRALPADDYFDTMAAHAGGHWWYRARRMLVAQLLDGRMPAGGVALDIGCGTGEVVDLLGQLGASVAAGTDLSDHVLHHAAADRRAGAGAILASAAERLPFAGRCADALTSLEVVEHLDDDLGALREYHRVLRPGATLLVTVPSYQWLWYHQDDLAGHRRRYTRRGIVDVVEAAGFEVTGSSYYFSFLVPPAIAQRKTPLRRFLADNGETSSSGRAVTAVMDRLCRAERAWMRRGLPVPFGLSIWVLARRP